MDTRTLAGEPPQCLSPRLQAEPSVPAGQWSTNGLLEGSAHSPAGSCGAGQVKAGDKPADIFVFNFFPFFLSSCSIWGHKQP